MLMQKNILTTSLSEDCRLPGRAEYMNCDSQDDLKFHNLIFEAVSVTEESANVRLIAMGGDMHS